jgi:hypothetical protein
LTLSRTPLDRSIFTTSWFGSGARGERREVELRRGPSGGTRDR